MVYVALGIIILLALGIILLGLMLWATQPRIKGGVQISERDEMKLWGKND